MPCADCFERDIDSAACCECESKDERDNGMKCASDDDAMAILKTMSDEDCAELVNKIAAKDGGEYLSFDQNVTILRLILHSHGFPKTSLAFESHYAFQPPSTEGESA